MSYVSSSSPCRLTSLPVIQSIEIKLILMHRHQEVEEVARLQVEVQQTLERRSVCVCDSPAPGPWPHSVCVLNTASAILQPVCVVCSAAVCILCVSSKPTWLLSRGF